MKRNMVFSVMMIVGMLMPLSAYAHLIENQHGTLNFVERDVYMVLSVPISAFTGIDDDRNNRITMIEFNNHRSDIILMIQQKVTMTLAGNHVPLRDIVLSPVTPHSGSTDSLSDLTVMGKFSLEQTDATLDFGVRLFGIKIEEQSLNMTAIDSAEQQRRVFELTPNTPIFNLIP